VSTLRPLMLSTLCNFEHRGVGIGATRHRPPPLIGWVTGHGFQSTDETSALQNLNVVHANANNVRNDVGCNALLSSFSFL
jgi:hypothetical protein